MLENFTPNIENHAKQNKLRMMVQVVANQTFYNKILSIKKILSRAKVQEVHQNYLFYSIKKYCLVFNFEIYCSFFHYLTFNQYGFEKLYHIVPSLRNSITCKVSKASMLQKAAEHIHQLKSSQNELNKELNDFKNEINSLSDQISDLQNELPENGVSILGGNINKTEKFRQKFNAYVQERTIENWKFYIFSTVMKPLFENYIESINTVSKEELEHSVMHWHSQYCNLTNLRPCKNF